MARPLRIEYPGAVYHVTSRGNARLPIFDSDKDRRSFLNILEEVVKRFNWFCHAFCLMDNHYHLLIETIDGNLSLGMRHLNGVYTQRFNRRNNRVGHIFQGRFKSILVERDSYLLALCRYVVLNPVRAGMVKTVGSYGWSSYRATSGLKKAPSLLSVDWILSQFGKERKEAQREYRKFVSSGVGTASPWEDLKSQCILGGRDFVERIKPALKDTREVIEFSKRDRLVDRPPLEEIFSSENWKTKSERNRLIYNVHFEFGYTLTEIAIHLGLHYSTVSRVINRKTL